MVSADLKRETRLLLISKTGTCVVCSYNAYSISSAFHIQTSKCYLGAQQVRSQHLVSRIHKLGRDSSSGYSCVHIYCMYIFLLDLAVVDWPWFKWDYSRMQVRDSLVAMYTFIVGPWLPTSNAISEGLRHKPVRDYNSQTEICLTFQA